MEMKRALRNALRAFPLRLVTAERLRRLEAETDRLEQAVVSAEFRLGQAEAAADAARREAGLARKDADRLMVRNLFLLREEEQAGRRTPAKVGVR